MRSLFIGRWQPFHKGHKALIDTALLRGKDVLIAVRMTGVDEKNPFTYEERVAKIREIYPDEEKVKIIPIDDIDEVLYGRDVGYSVKKVELPQEIEEISATKIRNDYLDRG